MCQFQMRYKWIIPRCSLPANWKPSNNSLESSQHWGTPTELPLQKVNKLMSCTVCTLSSQPFDSYCRTEPSLPCVQYTSEQITHRVNERCWTQVFNFFLARAPEDTAGVVTSTPHTVVLWVSCLAAATISVSHRAVVKSHCKGEKFRGTCKHPHRAQHNPATRWLLQTPLFLLPPWQVREVNLCFL